eukprot:332688-Hanusia_phi.AAC.1
MSAPADDSAEKRPVTSGAGEGASAHKGNPLLNGNRDTQFETPPRSIGFESSANFSRSDYKIKPASGMRYVIYYDEDDKEITRKLKGPGRLPRGAFLGSDGHYLVKGCQVNSKGEILPLAAPSSHQAGANAGNSGLDQDYRKEKRERKRTSAPGAEFSMDSDKRLRTSAFTTETEPRGQQRTSSIVPTFETTAMPISYDLHAMVPSQVSENQEIIRARRIAKWNEVSSLECSFPRGDGVVKNYGVELDGRFSFQKGKEFNLDIKKVKTSFGYSGGIKGDDNWEDEVGNKEAPSNQSNGEIKKFLSDWKHCVSSEKRSIIDIQSNQHALGMPTFVLDDKQVTLYDIYQAVKEHGGSSKLHSWRIVADQLLLQKSSEEARSGAIASLGFCTAVRKIFFESGLDKLENYEMLRSTKEVGSPRRGSPDKNKRGKVTEAVPKQDGDAMLVDEKVESRTLQQTGAESQDSFTIFENGVLKEISKVGLVVKDGLLHHEELAARNLSISFADQQKYQKWSTDAQTKKKWREKYQEFISKHLPQGPRTLSVKIRDKEVELFDFYHVVKKSGGLEAVVRQRMWYEVCKLLGVKADYQVFVELRKLYLRHLFAFEVHDIHGIEIGDVREELFSAPLPRKMAKGIADARKRVEEGHSLLARVGEETQGRAGLSGFVNTGSKPFLDRCKGSSDPDNPIARGKKICRALESGLHDELMWALGVLSLNSWEAANGCEPHVELSEGICCALARFLYRLARQPELLDVACNRWGEV